MSPRRSARVGRKIACHASPRCLIIAASSTTTLAYLRPRATSGVSRLHMSTTPPVISSSLCCWAFRRTVTGWRMFTTSRQTSASILYVGENQPTG